MALKPKIPLRGGLFRQPLLTDISLRDRVLAYLKLQRDSLRASFGHIWETPVASLLTILVVGIALALPASFLELMQNARQPIETLQVTSEISLFLKPELPDSAGRKLAEQLAKNQAIAATRQLTKADGLRELAAYSGFGDALSALGGNPLPTVILIQPAATDADSVGRLLVELKQLPEADKVQFDAEWLEKLRALLAIFERIAVAFSLLLGLGVVFIVGNTIRLELNHRRDEITVAKLLGATDRFIRGPFLHSAFWFAFLGAGLAWGLANLLILTIRGPANRLAELYNSPYRLSFLGLPETLWLLAVAILLGIAGAWIVVSHTLHEIEPE
jgi:cell division transport system permease protein